MAQVEKKVESMSIRFDQPTLEALKDRSLVEDRSPSDLVRRAVNLYLYGVMGAVSPNADGDV